MLALPNRPTEIVKLADWIELVALMSPDGDASGNDLEGALRAAALFPTDDEDACIERACLEVFGELEARRRAALDAYPFDVEPPVLKMARAWQQNPAYVFCLCLSYFGDRQSGGGKRVYPRRWFEHLSRDAARNYIGGEAVRFASPRDEEELPKAFSRAVDRLSAGLLLEGGGFKKGGLPSPKDSGVDIIAWKHFPDRSVGKLLLFGNCASEENWDGAKRTELAPDAFCQEWMQEVPASRVVHTFFIPHRCADANALAAHCRRAGIVFDRCRIAYHAVGLHRPPPAAAANHGERVAPLGDMGAWAQAIMKASARGDRG